MPKVGPLGGGECQHCAAQETRAQDQASSHFFVVILFEVEKFIIPKN